MVQNSLNGDREFSKIGKFALLMKTGQWTSKKRNDVKLKHIKMSLPHPCGGSEHYFSLATESEKKCEKVKIKRILQMERK